MESKDKMSLSLKQRCDGHFNMNKKILGLVIISVIFTSQSWAKTCKDTLVVGVENFEEFLPFSEYKNKKYSGFNRDLLDEFAKKENLCITYKPMSIRKLYRALKKGTIDLKYPDSPFWGKDKKGGLDMKYSEPVIECIDGVLVTPNLLIQGHPKTAKIVLPKGYTAFALLKAAEEKKVELIVKKNLFQTVNSVVLNLTDGAYLNILVARNLMKTQFNNADALVFDSRYPFSAENWHLSSHKRPDIVKKFDQFLKEDEKKVTKLKVSYGADFKVRK